MTPAATPPDNQGVDRRLFLQLGALALVGGCAPAPTGADPFPYLRRRWQEVTAKPYDLSDLPRPSFVATPARFLAMARAYADTGDASLGKAVAAGIDDYRERVYAVGADPVGNWWHWQIGVPRKLLDAAILIGPQLSDHQRGALLDAVDHFVPERRLGDYSGTSTGANRVDLCVVMLLRALLGSDLDKLDLAVTSLDPVFRYVTEGDGFYRDGSFIQHSTVPYQGTYGVTLLEGVATMFAVLRGTPWEVTSQVVFDSVERSFLPFVREGILMDLVRGRAVGRVQKGPDLAAAILLLGESASAADRERWRIHREPVGHRLFPMSARAVHRRPGWCAALSMASYRIGHYEHGNGENQRGWHTGSGMLYWWADGRPDPYADGFWDTVDPYRLPGTTVSTKRLPDGAGPAWGDTCPPGRWVGGATDGTYATVGQHLNGLESTMEAFKSWFFLDDAVLCLGAGITSADGVPIETVVDNRRTDAPLTVEGQLAHLDGHGGYVVLDGATLRTKRAKGYATLWLDHGVDPAGAGYAYLLMPGATLAQTRAGLVASVLANTARQQAIHVPALNVTAVNFWNAGTVGALTVSAPCAVLVRKLGDGTATVTVSDPRDDLDELTVTWDRPVTEVLSGDARATTGVRTITLAFGRLGSASRTVKVRLG